MKAHRLRLMALSSFGLLGACAAEGPSGPLNVSVAPLTLPGIADVCYGLTVFNGVPATADTVWSQQGICSSQYGNSGGGDITYIGTCDADSGSNNYVELILETIEVDGGTILDDQFTVQAPPDGDGDADFTNPCAEAGDCVLNFPCVENEDVFVEFNITVMRDAEQGFFDIAVNFEDIFCSAKFDSCVGEEADNTPVPPRFVRDVSIDRNEKSDILAFAYNHTDLSAYYVFATRGSQSEGITRVDTKGNLLIWAAARTRDLGGNASSKDMHFAGLRAESAVQPETTITITDVGTINAATARLATKPNNLLFGADGERQHTAVAALACTAGPDAEGTELVFSAPVIRCQTAAGDKVNFKLDGLDTIEEGDGGNHEISVFVGAEPGTEYTMGYGVYFDTEDLTCGQEFTPGGTEHATNAAGNYLYTANGDQTEYYTRYVNGAWRLYFVNAVDEEIQVAAQDGPDGTPPASFLGGTYVAYIVDVPPTQTPISCNKAFYNLAFNIGGLADQGLIGCSFDWGASAIETGSDVLDSDGFLADVNGVYPGISYSGIVLTGKPDQLGVVPTLCSENPLNGDWSSVQTGYVKGSGFGEDQTRGVDYNTDSTDLPTRYGQD